MSRSDLYHPSAAPPLDALAAPVPAAVPGDGGPPPAVEATGAVACLSVKPSRRTSRAAFFEEPVAEDDPLLGFAPYVHAAPRRNSITPDRQRAFVAALAATGIVTQAARHVGVSLEALYKLRHRKGAEGFSAAWDKAIDRGMMRLEDCALERAIMGEERPVVSMGQVVTTYTRHDTALMMFLLRHRASHRYGREEERDPQPGSPVYERIRKHIQSDDRSLEDVRAAIWKKLEALRLDIKARQEREAAEAMASGEATAPGETGWQQHQRNASHISSSHDALK